MSPISSEIEKVAGSELSDLESPTCVDSSELFFYAKELWNKGDFFTSVHRSRSSGMDISLRDIDSDDNIIVIIEDDEEEFFMKVNSIELGKEAELE